MKGFLKRSITAFAKLSSSEIEETRAEARKLIAEIVQNISENPKNQDDNKFSLIDIIKTSQIDESVKSNVKKMLERITRKIINNPETVIKES